MIITRCESPLLAEASPVNKELHKLTFNDSPVRWMATPSKLSWSRRKEARVKASTVSLVSDEDCEKENSGALDRSVDNKSLQGRSRVGKGRRRESTILAGNLSYQVESGQLFVLNLKILPPGKCCDCNNCRHLCNQETPGHPMHTGCAH